MVYKAKSKLKCIIIIISITLVLLPSIWILILTYLTRTPIFSNFIYFFKLSWKKSVKIIKMWNHQALQPKMFHLDFIFLRQIDLKNTSIFNLFQNNLNNYIYVSRFFCLWPILFLCLLFFLWGYFFVCYDYYYYIYCVYLLLLHYATILDRFHNIKTEPLFFLRYFYYFCSWITFSYNC